ncbi:MAG: GDP-mannose 4,6-dehydratase [Acidimicrobiaceae bacterium]|nr:GDP-mannose 4,6-dehydratase [Acidimicrobiaceae bacterium]
MRALVTGANGFVGLHLVAHLNSCGDEVIESETDILDREAITATMSAARPDVVYHLAAQADVGGSWDSPVETLRVNVEGTLNVCDASRVAGARRVLGITSADVYGQTTRTDSGADRIDETAPLRPTSPYAASKAAAESIYMQAGLGHGLDVVLARSFNHLGPGQSDRFVASAIASRIAANERSGATTVPVGNLEARRDFTDVRDVVRAYRLLMQHGIPGEIYNVCTGQDRAIREIAEQLVGLAAFPMTLELDPDLLRPVDLKALCGDNTKIRARTGWAPQTPIETTLGDLLEFWRLNPAGVETPHPT